MIHLETNTKYGEIIYY